MLKMVWLSILIFNFFLSGLTAASQEYVEHLTLQNSSPSALQALSHSDVPLAVSVGNEHLKEVSSSVILAESWVRTHVLTHYPATKITTIVVGHGVLCNTNQENRMGFILSSVKNIYYSLTRWGLEREIKVSSSFSSNCLNQSSGESLAHKYIEPLLNFLQDINSPYLVNPPPSFSTSPDETLNSVSSHTEFMNNLGVFNLNKVNVLVDRQKETKPISRKLSFMDPEVVKPFPARPTPLTPTHSPVGNSAPAFGANGPLPPLVGTFPPPPFSLPFAPELPPVAVPAATPPYGPNLPPCNPHYGGPPTPPVVGPKNELWCVAKPSVPAETLQEAMDYACGEGGADCEAIQSQGSCYFPNTIVAHASYAFNSYWQKNKRNGGTCSFGGAAMLINADPSFRQCRFILA